MRMTETHEKLLEHFDTNIHDKLRIQQEQAQQRLDQISRMFWQLSHHVLTDRAEFNDNKLTFELQAAPAGSNVAAGLYQLVSKDKQWHPIETAHKYRLGHPLGEWVLDSGRRLSTPMVKIVFDLSGFAKKLSSLQSYQGQSGWLELNQLQLSSFQNEEHLVFTACTDDGERLDDEHCADLFLLSAKSHTLDASVQPPESLSLNAKRQLDARLSQLSLIHI